MIEASDGSLYTGVTNNIRRRWSEHCSGRGAKYFRGRSPGWLRYLEPGHDRSSAGRREVEIKRLTRTQKKQLIVSRRNRLQLLAEAGGNDHGRGWAQR